MEKHKCKLCTRSFSNGRALGGHMKSHLATFPLPPKTTTIHQVQHQLSTSTTESASSSSFSLSSCDGQERVQQMNKSFDFEDKNLLGYVLRENPKKSIKFTDPEFAVTPADSSVIVQDRESETESRNPTRRRSKRTRKSSASGFVLDVKKLKFKNPASLDSDDSPSFSTSPLPPVPVVEQEPVSSVSDTSPEEDVAMCLMMLSRDAWLKNIEEQEARSSKEIAVKVNKIRGKFRCEKCAKLFRSSQALVSHKKICSLNVTEIRNSMQDSNERIFECPYCFKVFGSGQALGGHKRSHLIASTTNASSATNEAPVAMAASVAENSVKHEMNMMIDLNLPAPMDDDEFSVVSDA